MVWQPIAPAAARRRIGTNGKTTTATLIYEMARLEGYKAGLLSTVVNYIDTEAVHADQTTPDPLTLNRLLRQMVDAGCEYAAMEVSSHAAHQHRIAGLHFAGGVFTNLTRDHLDYHKTVDAYLAAKNLFSTTFRPRPSRSPMPTTRPERSCCRIPTHADTHTPCAPAPTSPARSWKAVLTARCWL